MTSTTHSAGPQRAEGHLAGAAHTAGGTPLLRPAARAHGAAGALHHRPPHHPLRRGAWSFTETLNITLNPVHAVMLLQNVSHISVLVRHSGPCMRHSNRQALPAGAARCFCIVKVLPASWRTVAAVCPGHTAGHQAQLQQLGLFGKPATGPVQHAQARLQYRSGPHAVEDCTDVNPKPVAHGMPTASTLQPWGRSLAHIHTCLVSPA